MKPTILCALRQKELSIAVHHLHGRRSVLPLLRGSLWDCLLRLRTESRTKQSLSKYLSPIKILCKKKKKKRGERQKKCNKAEKIDKNMVLEKKTEGTRGEANMYSNKWPPRHRTYKNLCPVDRHPPIQPFNATMSSSFVLVQEILFAASIQRSRPSRDLRSGRRQPAACRNAHSLRWQACRHRIEGRRSVQVHRRG